MDRAPRDILAERVRDALQAQSVSEKQMFGGITFKLRDHMLCCVSAKGLMARVGVAAEAEALAEPHAARCSGAGRPMPGFVIVAPEGVADPVALSRWLDRALAYVAALPPKATAKRKRRDSSSQEKIHARR